MKGNTMDNEKKLRSELAASNARIDQIRSTCCNILKQVYDEGLGDDITDICSKRIKELMTNESASVRLLGAVALLGMTDAMASLGTIVLDMVNDD
jgi:hypothetical protein